MLHHPLSNNIDSDNEFLPLENYLYQREIICCILIYSSDMCSEFYDSSLSLRLLKIIGWIIEILCLIFTTLQARKCVDKFYENTITTSDGKPRYIAIDM